MAAPRTEPEAFPWAAALPFCLRLIKPGRGKMATTGAPDKAPGETMQATVSLEKAQAQLRDAEEEERALVEEVGQLPPQSSVR